MMDSTGYHKKVLFDLWHPAQFHYAKNVLSKFRSEGYEVFITCRPKDILTALLDESGEGYSILWRRGGTGILYNLIVLVIYVVRLTRMVRKHRIDVLIGSSPAIVLVSVLVRNAKSVLLIEDDISVIPLMRPFYPFADHLLTPDCLPEEHGRKHVKYASYHELAYLHPNHFTPDESVLEQLRVAKGESFFLLRFSALTAHHDIGARGISPRLSRQLLQVLQPHGKVFITAEGQLPAEFEQYRLPVPLSKIHSVLHYATLYVGDSQTMALEAALVGTPAIRCNTFVGRLSVLEELEKRYGLAFGFLPSDEDDMLQKIRELLQLDDLKRLWRSKLDTLLSEKVDFAEYLFRFVSGS